MRLWLVQRNDHNIRAASCTLREVADHYADALRDETDAQFEVVDPLRYVALNAILSEQAINNALGGRLWRVRPLKEFLGSKC